MPKKEKNPIEAFANELIKQANVTLPETELAAYKERLMDQIQRRLGLISLSYLDKKGLTDYEKLIEKESSPGKIRDFFSSRIDNYQEKITKALEEFSRDFFSALRK